MAKLKAKAQPTKPGGRGKGRRKGGRKTKGRGKGNKFRKVDGEEEQDDQEYDDEYEEEDQGEDNPEPEADPSAGGSVKQIHEQITMCVKGCESGTSRNERPVADFFLMPAATVFFWTMLRASLQLWQSLNCACNVTRSKGKVSDQKKQGNKTHKSTQPTNTKTKQPTRP